MGRHLLARPAVDDQRLLGTHPAGHPGGVHRRVAAAVDGHAAPDHRPLAGGDAAQERHRVHDPPGVPRRDVDALGQVCAHRDEDRVEAALLPLGGEVLDAVRGDDPHAQRRDPVQLAAQDVARHPIRRDAVAHHPAGLGARVPDLDVMTEPREVIRRRQPARPRADDEHPLAGRGRRRVEGPPPLQRQVAEEPLDRVNRNGAVELGTVADALARVVADPPVNRRERVVGHQLTPRLLVATRLRVRQPGLDVLSGRAAGVARGQQVDVDRPVLANGSGAGARVDQVGQRRDVPPRNGHTVAVPRPAPRSRAAIALRLRAFATQCPAASRSVR